MKADPTRRACVGWHEALTRTTCRTCSDMVLRLLYLSVYSKSEHPGWAERGIRRSAPVSYDAPTRMERIVIPVLPTIGWILIVVGVIVLILGVIPQVGLSSRGPYGWGGGLLLIIVGVVLLFIPA